MKKRIVLILAAILASLLIFASCGGDNAVNPPITGQPDQLLAIALAKLKDGQYDLALDYFEAAYANDHPGSETFPKTVVFSSLARMAGIPKDNNFRALMTQRFGIKNYPNTLDQLFTFNWMAEYKSIDTSIYSDQYGHCYWNDKDEDLYFFYYYDLEPISGYYYYNYSIGNYALAPIDPVYMIDYFPGLDLPGWFKNTSVYQETLLAGGLYSTTTFPMLLMANLIDKNTAGLNLLLDGVLNTLFGATFEDAAGRSALLNYTDYFVVDEDLLEAFGLYGMFEGDVKIGRAELDMLFSVLRMLKASLEWVTAYDWNTDISFMKFDWYDWEALMGVFDNLGNASLPFRNNFLKDRNNNRMTDSKNDFSKALKSTTDAYDFLISNNSYYPDAAVDTMKEFKWIRNGLDTLRTEIGNGGAFFVTLGDGSTYINDITEDTLLGIDLGNFFTPGYLGIDKLIDSTTTDPKFYIIYNDDPYDCELITSSEDIDDLFDNDLADYVKIGFKVNMSQISELLLYPNVLPDDLYIPMPTEAGAMLYSLYH